MTENNAAFTNHKHNGVYLQFPNGNAISTIWGVGSYTDNHDKSFSQFSSLIPEGLCIKTPHLRGLLKQPPLLYQKPRSSLQSLILPCFE